MEAGSSSNSSSDISTDVKRPDKVYPYRLNFWADIVSEDNTSELMNVLGMMLSMVGILLKYKACAWLGVMVAAISYANVRSTHDSKQIMSTFLLSISSVVMCYLISPAPMSQMIIGQEQSQQVLDQQPQVAGSDGVAAGQAH